MTSPVIAEAPSGCCFTGFQHEGTPTGHEISLGGMQTYISKPSKPTNKILLFFSDIMGPLYVNNKLLQDYFASNGFTVLGPDYFFGDLLSDHTDPDFDRNAWMDKAVQRAREATPKWIEAVKETYGTTETKYVATGYCFGGSFSMNAASMKFISAAAVAHPAFLNEAHFEQLKSPLLLSCAETDHTFGLEFRRRAEDILLAAKATYHFQVFSGVSHGFASRGNDKDPYIQWCKEESARGIVSWFKQFCG